ncbi:MAG: class I SAM-dependent methyltransferase [Pseudomonadota bacterium]
MTDRRYADPLQARSYVAGPRQFVPGYDAMHTMAAQLIAEHAGPDARILVLGAGGGLETASFARLQPGWRFVGVDPHEAMLEQARITLREAGVLDRVELTCGYMRDSPPGPFDGASCLLTLHFLEGEDAKRDALTAIRERLPRGARLVLVDLCLDRDAPDFDMRRDRYARFALNAGADAADVATTRARLKEVLSTLCATREAELIAEAGFVDAELFYAAMSWRGWVAKAP